MCTPAVAAHRTVLAAALPQVLLSFLRANRDARVRRLSLGTVLSLLDGADEVLRRAPRPEPPAAPPARVEWHALPQHPLARVVGAAGELHAAWEEAVASAGVPASWTADAASQPAEALLTSAQEWAGQGTCCPLRHGCGSVVLAADAAAVQGRCPQTSWTPSRCS